MFYSKKRLVLIFIKPDIFFKKRMNELYQR